MTSGLEMWVVYENPTDRPEKFAARKWLAEGGDLQATLERLVADTLGELYSQLPPGLVRFPRSPGDAPTVRETWI